MRYYPAHEVHAALKWSTLDSALSAAFAEGAESPLRHAHALNEQDALLIMPAWNASHIGVKVVTVIPTAGAHGAATVGASYLLLDRTTGEGRAVLDGEALTVRRTAVTSAIAARYMARQESRVLLMIGTGQLAPWMVRAHCAMRPSLTQVLVWGRNAAKAAAMADVLRGEGLPVSSTEVLADAVRAADIVSCATTSSVPIVRSEWIAPGTHVDLVGGFTPTMREVDDALVARSRIVVDTYAGVLAEGGDIVQPLSAGVITRDHIVAELSELVRGERAGRLDASDVTLFKSVGTALADLAAAMVVARATNVSVDDGPSA